VAVEVALVIVIGYAAIALFNSWYENARRLRCGAREGLFGTCRQPVNDASLRCSRHRGLLRRRWP
jgi:hypothetical protein